MHFVPTHCLPPPVSPGVVREPFYTTTFWVPTSLLHTFTFLSPFLPPTSSHPYSVWLLFVCLTVWAIFIHCLAHITFTTTWCSFLCSSTTTTTCHSPPLLLPPTNFTFHLPPTGVPAYLPMTFPILPGSFAFLRGFFSAVGSRTVRSCIPRTIFTHTTTLHTCGRFHTCRLSYHPG